MFAQKEVMNGLKEWLPGRLFCSHLDILKELKRAITCYFYLKTQGIITPRFWT